MRGYGRYPSILVLVTLLFTVLPLHLTAQEQPALAYQVAERKQPQRQMQPLAAQARPLQISDAYPHLIGSSTLTTSVALAPVVEPTPATSNPVPPGEIRSNSTATIGQPAVFETTVPKPAHTPDNPTKLTPSALTAPPSSHDKTSLVDPLIPTTVGWTTIMSEGFEGVFPNTNWRTFDNNGTMDGEYFWDDDNYRPHTNSWSAWPARGGANGVAPQTYYYPNNAQSWMVYGPFDLRDAAAAELQFYYWNQSEQNYDWLNWYASTNGTDFYGYRVSGDSSGWQFVNFDLTTVPTLGNLAGSSNVWIAFDFTSDSSNVDDGPFIDDIVLQKYIPSQPNLTPYTPSGWDYPIVPANTTGTYTVNSLYTNQNTYIDWALINSNASIANTFRSCLYFDNTEVQCWNTNGLGQNYYAYIEDWALNIVPSVGAHTLKIVTDVDNVVAESNESDNVWAQTFTWSTSGGCGPYTNTAAQTTLGDNNRWLARNFVLSDAPPDASIATLALKYALNHPHPEQVEVELVQQATGKRVPLTALSQIEPGQLTANLVLTDFAGVPAEGIWTLQMRDTVPGDQGTLVYALLQATYTATGPLVQITSDPPGSPAIQRLAPDALSVSRPVTESKPPSQAPLTPPSSTAFGWSEVMVESFEGAFPSGAWSVLDISSDGCEFLWDDDDYRHTGGNWAAWPANGGINGLDPATNKYPPNMVSWMIYGPFDLSDASDAKLTFNLWLQTETNYDKVFVGVSNDGSNFSGYNFSGSYDWSLKEIGFSSYSGDSSVWIGFSFSSDGIVNMEGPWVDDVKVEKYTGFILGDCTNGFTSNALTAEQLASAYAATHQVSTANVSSHPDPYEIALQSRRFIPQPGVDVKLMQMINTVAPQQNLHMLVQMYDWPSPEQQATLSQQGIQLLHYLPSRTWIASIRPDLVGSLSTNPLIRWAGPLTTDDRMSPLLTDPSTQQLMTQAATQTLALIVEFASDLDQTANEAVIARHHGAVVRSINSINGLMVILPTGELQSLASEDGVIWIEPPLPQFDPLNDCVRQRIGVNRLQSAPYNLTGNGVDMLVYDAGTVATSHSGFTGRLTIGDSSNTGDHATHVAGTAAGNGSGSPFLRDLKGMAPDARIISYGFESSANEWLYNDPGDIESDWRTAKNTYGADLGTASIGTNTANNGFPCDWEGNYGAVSQLIDAIVRGSLGEPYITTWAAGNERGGSRRCGTGYGTTAPPANAKNPIHVGATHSDSDVITAFSSFGPSDDGRIKPTIAAPGCEQGGEGFINSTLPSNQYGSSAYCGTSMATPAVAGAVALMIQQYRVTYNSGGEPLPSTIKALLIHTAVDKGNPGPDYQYGYGRIDTVSALDALIAGGFREETMQAGGEVHEYLYPFSGSIPELRVSLAWDDAPATPSALTQLVNDLDLRLVSPSGQTFYPFILDPANPGQTATTGDDARNNQEQVIIANPEAGTWKIRVQGYAVPTSPQQYSIVFNGALNAPLTKTPPPPSMPSNLQAVAVSQTQINLTWSDNSSNEAGFNVERSLNGSGGWSQIARVGANVTAYQNEGLTCGTTYYYRVQADNAGGTSSYSNVVNAPTIACALSTPTRTPTATPSNTPTRTPTVTPSNTPQTSTMIASPTPSVTKMPTRPIFYVYVPSIIRAR